MLPIIVWFRQDLRLHDNPALFYAAEEHSPILPVYIFDDTHKELQIGAAQKWWLHHSLTGLATSLAQRGMNLLIFRGNPQRILQDLLNITFAKAIYWNRCYEPAAILRDKKIKKEFEESGIAVKTYSAHLLFEPWEIYNQKGEYFKVFTPYWKTCLKHLTSEYPLKLPEFNEENHRISKQLLSLIFKNKNYSFAKSIAEWNLLPNYPNWAKDFANEFQPGEEGAHIKLQQFLERRLENYATFRDFPAINATSQLSPHLHFGEISPRQILQQLQQISIHEPQQETNINKFLSELGWREFSYYLLYHYPQLTNTSFQQKFARFHWQTNVTHLTAWQKGLTGYPIIDAGMRQLWHSGWMHNRVRMLVASFLCKNLLIDWRSGAAWFWDTLLDADLANNSAGWQWVAGSGADAAPYFRIFNPKLQGEKFDPDGKYVKRWLPELAALPKTYIHKPWEAPPEILKAAKIVLGQNYPFPIVDLNITRNEALARYKSLQK